MQTPEPEKITVLSGPLDGSYFEFMHAVDSTYIDSTGDSLEVLVTPGSIFNLEWIDRNLSAFALVQGDVVSNLVKEGENTIQGIAPLFIENIYVFRLLPVGSTPRIVNFESIKKDSRVFAGTEGSGTHLAAQHVLEFTSRSSNKIAIVQGSISTAVNSMIDSIQKSKIDSIPYSFNIIGAEHPYISDIFSDGLFNGIDAKTHDTPSLDSLHPDLYSFISDMISFRDGYPVELVEFTNSHIVKGMSTLYNFDSTSVHVNFPEEDSVRTFSTRAYIVANRNIRESLVTAFWEILEKNPAFKERILKPDEDQVTKPHWPMPIHNDAFPYLEKHRLIEGSGTGDRIRNLYTVLVSLLIVMIGFLKVPDHYVNSIFIFRSSRLRHIYQRLSRHSAFIALLFLVSVIITAGWAIRNIEIDAAELYGYSTPLENMSIGEVVLWLLMFIVSGAENNIFPSNPSSQFVLLFMQFIVKLGGLALGVLYTWRWFDDIIGRQYGLNRRDFNDHYVVLGWDESKISFIRNLIKAAPKIRVVIVSENEANPLLRLGLPRKNVGYVNGSPLEKSTMNKVQVNRARRILIFTSNQRNNEASIGLPVAFSGFIKNFNSMENNHSKHPPISVVDPTDSAREAYKIIGVEMIEVPVIYNEIIPSLFEGGGMYSLIGTFLQHQADNKSPQKDKALGLREIKLTTETLASVTEVWQFSRIDEKSLFGSILHARDSDELLQYFEGLKEAFKQYSYLLIGITIKHEKNGINQTVHLVAPKRQPNTVPEKLNINEIYLMIMKLEANQNA